MADATQNSGTPTVLLPEAEVRRIVDDLAACIAPVIDDETVAAVLLTGGLWFAADLTRALARAGRHVRFDALWLASYGDEQSSRGRIDVYAPFQRPIAGRRVLILDDVFDTGFFSMQPDDKDDGGDGKGSAMSVTSVETARRNDGGGRFG